MRVCSKCKVEKELVDFYKSSRNKSGYRIQHISYDKKYRQHNKENLQPLCSKINRDIKKNNLEYVN